jgi:hypothetical protein
MQHLASAVRVDADGHYDGRRDDASALALLQVGGVDSQIGPLAIEAVPEDRTSV